ncbi:hypothetical protein FRB95_012079, partial [Tulasnella sp. JGI-2019a]
ALVVEREREAEEDVDRIGLEVLLQCGRLATAGEREQRDEMLVGIEIDAAGDLQ